MVELYQKISLAHTVFDSVAGYHLEQIQWVQAITWTGSTSSDTNIEEVLESMVEMIEVKGTPQCLSFQRMNIYNTQPRSMCWALCMPSVNTWETSVPRADETQLARRCLKGLYSSSKLGAEGPAGTESTTLDFSFSLRGLRDIISFSKNSMGVEDFLPSPHVHLIFSLEVSVLKTQHTQLGKRDYNFLFHFWRGTISCLTSPDEIFKSPKQSTHMGRERLKFLTHWVSAGTLGISLILPYVETPVFYIKPFCKKDLKSS